jgi:hypothetical protein
MHNLFVSRITLPNNIHLSESQIKKASNEFYCNDMPMTKAVVKLLFVILPMMEEFLLWKSLKRMSNITIFIRTMCYLKINLKYF